MTTTALSAGWGRPIIRPSVTAAAMGLAVGIAIAEVRDLSAVRAGLLLAEFALLGWIAGYDIETRRAPNILVLPAILAVLTSATLLGAGLSAATGSLVLFVVFFIIAAAGRGAMGAGDVKVAALCGAIAGVESAMALLLVTFLIGGLFAVVALLSGFRTRKDTLPFTPFLALGVATVVATFDGYLVG